MTKIDWSGMDERIRFGPAEDSGPSVRERDGVWWWADEAWQWHGPCSSESSARRRQAMYVTYLLERFPSEESGRPWPVVPAVWEAAMESEKENAIHPCTDAAPWDCECSGSCGCHWETRKTALRTSST